MVEIIRKPQTLASVTPSLGSRIERAQALIRFIAKIQAGKDASACPILSDPLVTARELGILDILGVTPEQVLDDKVSFCDSLLCDTQCGVVY